MTTKRTFRVKSTASAGHMLLALAPRLLSQFRSAIRRVWAGGEDRLGRVGMERVEGSRFGA
jgi:hypothetical protein